MKFAMLTYVPLEREALDVNCLTEVEIRRIDEYHADVYEKIAPYLNEEEKTWLKEVTKPLES